LWFNEKLYDYKQLATGSVSESSVVPLASLTQKPLLRLPEGSTLLRSLLSSDGKMIVFSVATQMSVNFLNNQNPSGQEEVVSYVFSYDIEKNKVTSLFNNSRLTSGGLYILPQSISLDNKYVSFGVSVCVECDAPATTVVFNLASANVEEIGVTENFKWLTDGNFEYRIPTGLDSDSTHPLRKGKMVK
jgi:hypothetical protein